MRRPIRPHVDAIHTLISEAAAEPRGPTDEQVVRALGSVVSLLGGFFQDVNDIAHTLSANREDSIKARAGSL